MLGQLDPHTPLRLVARCPFRVADLHTIDFEVPKRRRCPILIRCRFLFSVCSVCALSRFGLHPRLRDGKAYTVIWGRWKGSSPRLFAVSALLVVI